ncbi:MAG: hypothetical protein JXR82_14420 [Marinifilaceae bacterium]|nr:hypothetical protein [Marinifilaceae bacterium]
MGNKNRVGIIIQARTGSSRLPGKMLMPFFEGKGIFELLIERIQIESLNVPIVLATSNTEKDNELCLIARKHNVSVYRGSENDVLDRFINAAEMYSINKIIRICADNPFLDMESLKAIIDEFALNEVDYFAFRTRQGVPTIKTHYGFWAEGVSIDALLRVRKITDDSLYHEHVTNFIYSNTSFFTTSFLTIPLEIENSNVRMTLDTVEDFFVLKDIYEEFMKLEKQNLFSLITLVDTNHNWKDSMLAQIEINNK